MRMNAVTTITDNSGAPLVQHYTPTSGQCEDPKWPTMPLQDNHLQYPGPSTAGKALTITPPPPYPPPNDPSRVLLEPEAQWKHSRASTQTLISLLAPFKCHTLASPKTHKVTMLGPALGPFYFLGGWHGCLEVPLSLHPSGSSPLYHVSLGKTTRHSGRPLCHHPTAGHSL